MRPLRALAHLLVVVALLGLALAPGRAAGVAAAAMPEHQSGMDHHASGVHAAHAGHNHHTAASEQPTHTDDGCQTACCFIPSQLPPRASIPSAVEFFCAIRYNLTAQSASGRIDPPEPGIPKLVV